MTGTARLLCCYRGAGRGLPQVRLHCHRVSAQEVAEVLARVNREGRKRVD